MSKELDIGIRMKGYEEVAQGKLIKRMPVIIRIDGKSFHQVLKGSYKPFDPLFIVSMASTMEKLCQEIQDVVFGYCASDEISLILRDYQTLETQSWFNNRIQKIASISASIATYHFNNFFELFYLFHDENQMHSLYKDFGMTDEQIQKYFNEQVPIILNRSTYFDARCFNLPKEEVANYIYWRQLETLRNGNSAIGRVHYSQKELTGLKGNQINEKLLKDGHKTIYDYPIYIQRGIAWKNNEIDFNMPIIKGEGRNYIERLINI